MWRGREDDITRPLSLSAVIVHSNVTDTGFRFRLEFLGLKGTGRNEIVLLFL